MKVNIGYLNCYDSIFGPNLIKIFYNTKHKVCFSLKITPKKAKNSRMMLLF